MRLTPSQMRRVLQIVAWRPETIGDAFEQIGLVAAACERASSYQWARLHLAATSGEANLLERRATREGRTVSLFDNRSGTIDADESLRWYLVCDDHGGCVGTETLAAARAEMPRPSNWCPDCQEDRREREKGTAP